MLDAGTINRLRLEVPRGKRSEFIQRAIETALLDRKLISHPSKVIEQFVSARPVRDRNRDAFARGGIEPPEPGQG